MSSVVIVPTFNEEEGIADTLKSVPSKYPVFVVDGGSTDRTVEIAKNFGVDLIHSKSGKGNALRKVFRKLGPKFDKLFTIDGDGSYPGAKIPELERKLDEDFSLVLGSRLSGDVRNMPWNRKIGNYMINFLFNQVHGTDLTDILTGLRGITNSALKKIDLEAEGFTIESEITRKVVKNDFKIAEVPIFYQERKGESKLKFKDMIRIGIYNLR